MCWYDTMSCRLEKVFNWLVSSFIFFTQFLVFPISTFISRWEIELGTLRSVGRVWLTCILWRHTGGLPQHARTSRLYYPIASGKNWREMPASTILNKWVKWSSLNIDASNSNLYLIRTSIIYMVYTINKGFDARMDLFRSNLRFQALKRVRYHDLTK